MRVLPRVPPRIGRFNLHLPVMLQAVPAQVVAAVMKRIAKRVETQLQLSPKYRLKP